MRKLILIAFTLLVLMSSCKSNDQEERSKKYTLNGKLNGVENNSTIYLILDGKNVDSTILKNNQFLFEGVIDHPKGYNLLVKDSQDDARIWLEAGEITFEATTGKFKFPKVNGSNAHIESEKLWEPIWEYRNQRDSLAKIITNEQLSDNLKSEARLAFEKHEALSFKAESNFIKNNPNSYVSAKTLDFYSTTFSRNKVEELYNNFNQEIKESSYGKSISRFLSLNANPQIGDQYVDFGMTNEKGELIKLSDFEGKLVLLDFWASWCGPCIDEYPALKEAYADFNVNGFEIVSVSQDATKARWLNAIEQNDLNWINLWQENGNKADPYLIYGINGIPDNFLIDRNGTIIARNLRGEKLIEEVENNIK